MTLGKVVCYVAIVLAAGSSPTRAVSQDFQPIKPIQRFTRDVIAGSPSSGKPIDTAYKASRWYLQGATAFDMSTTVTGLKNPHAVEGDWARCFGSRNTPAIVAGNVALNIGVAYLSNNLYERGGKWKILATALNGAKATGNTVEGIRNFRYIGKR